MTNNNPNTERRQKSIDLTGRLAMIACLVMYISYIEQIIANFTGHPVSPIQPFFCGH